MFIGENANIGFYTYFTAIIKFASINYNSLVKY